MGKPLGGDLAVVVVGGEHVDLLAPLLARDVDDRLHHLRRRRAGDDAVAVADAALVEHVVEVEDVAAPEGLADRLARGRRDAAVDHVDLVVARQLLGVLGVQRDVGLAVVLHDLDLRRRRRGHLDLGPREGGDLDGKVDRLAWAELHPEIVPIPIPLGIPHGLLLPAALLEPGGVAVLVVVERIVGVLEEGLPEVVLQIAQAGVVGILYFIALQEIAEADAEGLGVLDFQKGTRLFQAEPLLVDVVEIERRPGAVGLVVLGAGHGEIIELIEIHQRAEMKIVMDHIFLAHLEDLEQLHVTAVGADLGDGLGDDLFDQSGFRGVLELIGIVRVGNALDAVDGVLGLFGDVVSDLALH